MTLQYDDLLGQPFLWGTSDCFSMARKFFDKNFNIKIRNYARPSSWSSDEFDMMRVFPEREGFKTLTEYKLKDLRPADVLCLAIGEANPNHFAIVVEDNHFIHHLYGRLSVKEDLTAMWVGKAAFILRHPDVPDLRPTYPDINIMDLIDARNTPKQG